MLTDSGEALAIGCTGCVGSPIVRDVSAVLVATHLTIFGTASVCGQSKVPESLKPVERAVLSVLAGEILVLDG